MITFVLKDILWDLQSNNYFTVTVTKKHLHKKLSQVHVLFYLFS